MNSEVNANILIVDETPSHILILQTILESESYTLYTARSSAEGLACVLQHDFAAILLSVEMSEMNGFEMARIIKAGDRTQHIPIIFISSSPLKQEEICHGYAIGAVDYMVKPIESLLLKAKVKKFVELFQSNQKLAHQAKVLEEKSRELERINDELSAVSMELRESEAMANVIFATSLDSMIITDEHRVILKINPAAQQAFMYSEEELLGKHISVLLKYEREECDRFWDEMGAWRFKHPREIDAVRKDDSSFPAEVMVGTCFVQNKVILACTFRDITNKKRSEYLITHMAYHDRLTDLPNRSYFNEQMHIYMYNARQKNEPLALLYLNLDRFKYINDSLGHKIGDLLLKQIAERLKATIREEDFIACFGGDEFNIILPRTNREQAISVAEDILNEFRQSFFIESYELYITTSIGMSVFPYDGEEVYSLLSNASAALYRAKEQGKNSLKLYHTGINIQTYRAFILQNDLRKAIERDELSLYYQPRLNLETGSIDSVEALVRWNHPHWGLILPSEFIPIAEETGLIVNMSDWVMRTACVQIRQWKATKQATLSRLRVSINFSAQQFMQRDFFDKLEALQQDTGANPEDIEIEITEYTLFGGNPDILSKLSILRDIGISISIDDFGAGYSSLNCLMNFPKDTLKIDKSIIQRLSDKSSDSITMVSAIITLAGSMNMSVIAEGVENGEQLQILQRIGCKAIQGYLFCPPVPPEELEHFIQNYDQPDQANQTYIAAHMTGLTRYASSAEAIQTDAKLNQSILQAAMKRTRERYGISARETEVLELLVKGLSNREISDQLFISEHTVKNHITHIFQKLNVSDRMQAMSYINQACMEESRRLNTLME
ncbi:EAL domain-containing protein [Paenibacillus barcinonensis]|uniref:EAL domain-containing protein n=1 Tax=Paenibacillus barcinonensis TaxID=198119 RepID=A0A2V4V8D4_PAEBA|nr:EAL domain-containing protein [Paenibacillus barcinonensis]PYE48835.1 PAS domain S-box-containing protein/diguanylate cyclase (GGDEF)-like protein [Paenibacillus barcinonensis]QKS57739.1 EAL domain-containing protein [Paenibacillus barcinonensis]